FIATTYFLPPGSASELCQERTAVQIPEQTPEGPVPFHLPMPLDRVKCPTPLATRGPATPLILVAPEPEMSPAREILCMTKRPLVAEMWPPLTAMPILMTPQWPLVVTRAMFQLPSNGAAAAGRAEAMIAKAVDRTKAQKRLPIMRVPMRVLYPEPISVRLLTVPGREI